ncbi:MAG: type II toxin-antitoxin system HicA family toxin [Desulfobacteraceae bacterium]|nr:type II toxin-antitoxin system HicA family toxin [Desulfobacteraceae bacterium]
MPKLPSSKEIIRVLKRNGFSFVSQKGSHKKFKKEKRIVIVPDPKKEIPMGTFSSILRQSGINKEEFKTHD